MPDDTVPERMSQLAVLAVVVLAFADGDDVTDADDQAAQIVAQRMALLRIKEDQGLLFSEPAINMLNERVLARAPEHPRRRERWLLVGRQGLHHPCIDLLLAPP